MIVSIREQFSISDPTFGEYRGEQKCHKIFSAERGAAHSGSRNENVTANLFEECFTVDLFYEPRHVGERGERADENVTKTFLTATGENENVTKYLSAGDSRWIVFLGPPFEEEQKMSRIFLVRDKEEAKCPQLSLRDVRDASIPCNEIEKSERARNLLL